MLCVDVTAQMTAVNIPILYLQATQDKLVPRSASVLVLQCNAQTQIADMEASHCLLQTAPMEAAQAVLKFLKKCQA
jgi:esterase/lipase